MREYIELMYEDALFLAGFDEEITGVTLEGRVCYKVDDLIDKLMETNSWTYEDAWDYADFNIIGACSEEGTGPLLLLAE